MCKLLLRECIEMLRNASPVEAGEIKARMPVKQAVILKWLVDIDGCQSQQNQQRDVTQGG